MRFFSLSLAILATLASAQNTQQPTSQSMPIPTNNVACQGDILWMVAGDLVSKRCLVVGDNTVNNEVRTAFTVRGGASQILPLVGGKALFYSAGGKINLYRPGFEQEVLTTRTFGGGAIVSGDEYQAVLRMPFEFEQYSVSLGWYGGSSTLRNYTEFRRAATVGCMGEIRLRPSNREFCFEPRDTSLFVPSNSFGGADYQNLKQAAFRSGLVQVVESGSEFAVGLVATQYEYPQTNGPVVGFVPPSKVIPGRLVKITLSSENEAILEDLLPKIDGEVSGDPMSRNLAVGKSGVYFVAREQLKIEGLEVTLYTVNYFDLRTNKLHRNILASGEGITALAVEK